MPHFAAEGNNEIYCHRSFRELLGHSRLCYEGTDPEDSKIIGRFDESSIKSIRRKL